MVYPTVVTRRVGNATPGPIQSTSYNLKFRSLATAGTLKGIWVLTVETNTPILSLLWSTLYELQLKRKHPQPTRQKQANVERKSHDNTALLFYQTSTTATPPPTPRDTHPYPLQFMNPSLCWAWAPASAPETELKLSASWVLQLGCTETERAGPRTPRDTPQFDANKEEQEK